MGRDFNGTTSTLTGTLAASPSGDYTLGAWANPDNAGESSNGALLFVHSAGTARTSFRCATGLNLIAFQVHATTNASTTTSGTPLTTGEWQALFATYRASDKTVRIYRGDQDSPVAELSYGTQTAGVGTVTTATSFVVGNNSIASTTWDGRIEQSFIVPWEMTVDEMERYRLGDMSVLYDHGKPSLHATLAAGLVDLSGNSLALTATALTPGESPPVALSWAHV